MKRIYSIFLCLLALTSFGQFQAEYQINSGPNWRTDVDKYLTNDKRMLAPSKSVQIDGTNTIVLGNVLRTTTGDKRSHMAKIDHQGNIIWSKTYSNPVSGHHLVITGFVLNQNGDRIFACGYITDDAIFQGNTVSIPKPVILAIDPADGSLA